MSLVRNVGRGIADRVLDAYAAVAARWVDLRSTLPLAAGDFRDRLLDLAEGVASVPGSLRDRAGLGEWIRFRWQGLREAVLELPAVLARSGSDRIERLRDAAAGVADHRIFDFTSQRTRVAVGLGLFWSLLVLLALGVGFGSYAAPAAGGAIAARPAEIATLEGLRPIAVARSTRERSASAPRRQVTPRRTSTTRAAPVTLRASGTVFKPGASAAARPAARASARTTKTHRRPTTPGRARTGGTAPSGGAARRRPQHRHRRLPQRARR